MVVAMIAPLHMSVAPHVGAWIEIYAARIQFGLHMVASHVGAWIEIS